MELNINIDKIYKKNIIAYYIFSFFSNLQLHGVIFTLYMQKCGLTLLHIGIVLACFQITKLILEVPSGYLSDRYGRKLCTIIGQIFFLIFFVILLFKTNFKWFIIANIFQGASIAFLSGSIESIFVDTILIKYNEKKLSYFNSIDRLIFFISTGLGSLLGGIIAFKKYSSVFIISIFLQAFSLIMVYFIEDISPGKKGNINEDIPLYKYITFIKNNNALKYLILIDVLIAFSALPFGAYYPNILRCLNLNEFEIGLIISIQFIISGIIGTLNMRISNVINDSFIVKYFPCLIPCLYLIIFTFLKNYYVIAIFYIIILSIISVTSAIKYKYIQKSIDNKIRATILSVKSLSIAFVAIIVNPVVGYFSEKFSFNFIFIILSIISIIFMIINNNKLSSTLNFDN